MPDSPLAGGRAGLGARTAAGDERPGRLPAARLGHRGQEHAGEAGAAPVRLRRPQRAVVVDQLTDGQTHLTAGHITHSRSQWNAERLSDGL